MKAARPGLAIAAVFPAIMVPIALPALQGVGASDRDKGLTVGFLIGVSLLLLVLALQSRRAER